MDGTCTLICTARSLFVWACALLVFCGGFFLREFVKLIAPNLTGSDLIAATAAGALAIYFLSIMGAVSYALLKKYLLGHRDEFVSK